MSCPDNPELLAIIDLLSELPPCRADTARWLPFNTGVSLLSPKIRPLSKDELLRSAWWPK